MSDFPSTSRGRVSSANAPPPLSPTEQKPCFHQELELALINNGIPAYLLTALQANWPHLDVIDALVNFLGDVAQSETELRNIIIRVKMERDDLKASLVGKDMVSRQQYNAANEAKAELERRLADYAGDLADRNSEVEKLEQKNKELEQLIEEKSKSIDSMNSLNNELQAKLTSAQSKIDELEAKKSHGGHDLSKCIQQGLQLKQERDKLAEATKQVQQLEGDVEASTKKIKSLEQDRTKLEKQLEQVIAEHRANENRLKAKADDLQSQVNRWIGVANDRALKQAELESDLLAVRASLAESRVKLQQLDEIEHLQRKVAGLEKELQIKAETMVAKQVELDETNSKYEKMKDGYKKEIDNLNNKLRTFGEQAAQFSETSFREQIATLEKSKQDLKSELDETKQNLINARAEADNFKSKYEQEYAQFRNYHAKVKRDKERLKQSADLQTDNSYSPSPSKRMKTTSASPPSVSPTLRAGEVSPAYGGATYSPIIANPPAIEAPTWNPSSSAAKLTEDEMAQIRSLLEALTTELAAKKAEVTELNQVCGDLTSEVENLKKLVPSSNDLQDADTERLKALCDNLKRLIEQHHIRIENKPHIGKRDELSFLKSLQDEIDRVPPQNNDGDHQNMEVDKESKGPNQNLPVQAAVPVDLEPAALVRANDAALEEGEIVATPEPTPNATVEKSKKIITSSYSAEKLSSDKKPSSSSSYTAPKTARPDPPPLIIPTTLGRQSSGRKDWSDTSRTNNGSDGRYSSNRGSSYTFDNSRLSGFSRKYN